jgi:hypothetical protein
MHTLEELREMLRGRTWGSLLGVVMLDNGVTCRARLGVHMGRAVCAVIAENQFVAIKRLNLSAQFSPLTLHGVPQGMVDWGFAESPADELIIKDQEHDQKAHQDRDLQSGSIAAAAGTPAAEMVCFHQQESHHD